MKNDMAVLLTDESGLFTGLLGVLIGMIVLDVPFV